MEAILRTILYLMAMVAFGTGLNVLIGVAAAVPGASGPVEATVDNELRFFAVFWLAYGAFCFWVARHLAEQLSFVPAIAAVFFLGGVGRLVSFLSVGQPAAILIPAMILEFVLPLVVYALYRKLHSKQLSTAISY